jgi:hypothetical protein
MLSMPNQSDTVAVDSGGYFFMPAIKKMREMKLLDRPSSQWKDDEWATLKQVYSSCTHLLQDLLQTAQKTEKLAVFKEHTPFIISPTVQASFVHGNEAPKQPWRVELATSHSVPNLSLELPYNQTVLPSEFLLNCVPAFLIRHPALAFPSYYRVLQSLLGGNSQMDAVESALNQAFTLQWTRNLYDWFLAVNKITPTTTGNQSSPIVLDADDILTDPKLVLHFCDLVGLDRSVVQFKWDRAADEQLGKESPIRLCTRSTLFSSSGILPGKTFQGLTIDGEVAKWREEFGTPVADKLHSWVKMAMTDYEYLSSRRLQLPS